MRLLWPTFFPCPLMVLVRVSMAKLYINVSIIIIIFYASASRKESCHWCRISRFYQTLMFEKGPENLFIVGLFIFLMFCFVCFFAQKGKKMQTERLESLSLHHQGWQSAIPPFSGPFPLNTWSRGFLLPSESNFTWPHETFIHSARACWLLSNVPTENGGVRIFSGPLCRAIFL